MSICTQAVLWIIELVSKGQYNFCSPFNNRPIGFLSLITRGLALWVIFPTVYCIAYVLKRNQGISDFVLRKVLDRSALY